MRLEQSAAGIPDAGALSTAEGCAQFCSEHGAYGAQKVCSIEPDAGTVFLVCSFSTVCTGREPAGFFAPPRDLQAPLLGRYFAEMAAGEAASVAAFRTLAAELHAHGMPARLVLRVRRAAGEEDRHFRIAAALAKRFGARAARSDVSPQPSRTLLETAIENAREGVVRETMGAVFGHFQALHARDHAVRRAMSRIARDETSHAVLSWAVDEQLRKRLSTAECAELDEHRERALADLEDSLREGIPKELVERAGIPAPSVALALVRTAREELFS